MRDPSLHRSLLALGALVLAACGAKTGLRVPDVEQDATIDAPDVADVQDARDAQACVPDRFDLERRSAEIMIVVDRSNSMAFSLDGTPNVPPRRWEVLRDALRLVLPTFERSVAFGAKFYPQVIDPGNNNLDENCRSAPGIDLEPALGNGNAVLAFFSRTGPGGGTPTHDALLQTATYLRARSNRGAARYIVLATDGGPNCNRDNPVPPSRCVCTSSSPNACSNNPMVGVYNCLDATRTVSLIRDIAQPAAPNVTPIPVYVVGLDGSMTTRTDLLAVLDDMAIAGGRPRPRINAGDRAYYSARNPGDLERAFDSIVAPLARCSFVTQRPPNNAEEVEVEVDGRVIARDMGRVEGWDWTDPMFGEVTFYGSACAQASSSNARVQLRIGCREP